ncbi:T9SS type A sorting domain-containing protein [Flavilitoribacter nigricans]|uniref:Secretion system C-terminal sorting domain-containing protein n=1 Tax=Flavilitoribacter nigricans (strain ATCC 23147 / DSM 23189 / NBRC 102662 / NCIMB 1420 / SS-2) TaxID=1122177 RepID=A0A2D0NIA1_FLAN2|nr:T9SS type A sorting domain-containing protein [Flavilitoribacter nigricans]PHN08224.1 hypothetical protein CRP01_02565 [Flavilitoribacter nigricans DSM 23189 = NBRC 102662]
MSSRKSYALCFVLLFLWPAYGAAQLIPYEGLSGVRQDLWEETSWTGGDSLEITYNEARLPVTIKVLTFDEGEWRNSDLLLAEYNAEQQPEKLLTQEWNNEQWENAEQEIYYYGTSEKYYIQTFQRWEEGRWNSIRRDTRRFNDQELLIEWAIEDGYDNYWNNSRRYSYSYNEKGNRTEYRYDLGMGSEWMYLRQTLYTYDTLDRLILETTYDHSPVEPRLSMQSVYQYDERNNQTHELSQRWVEDQWQNSHQYLTYYDTRNNETLYVSQNWLEAQWENSYLFRSGYDDHDNLIFLESQDWAIWDSTWINDFRTTFEYNDDNLPTLRSSFLWYNDVWEPSERVYYYYEIVNKVADNRLARIPVRVYPNPNDGQFTLELPAGERDSGRLTLHDASGRLIYAAPVSPGQDQIRIKLVDVPDGVYYLQLKTTQEIATRPVMIRR